MNIYFYVKQKSINEMKIFLHDHSNFSVVGFDPRFNSKSSKMNEPKPEPTIDFVSEMRAFVLKDFPTESEEFVDLIHAIDTVGGLLAANKEILERCEESKLDSSRANFFKCKRINYNTLKIGTNDGHATFKTYPWIETEDFDITPLVELPLRLRLLEHKKDDHGFIDFGELFSKSMVLHPDVLLPFLVAFKAHLELVQVCLGAIEEWIIQSQDNAHFLESTFGWELAHKKEKELRTWASDWFRLTRVPFEGNLEVSFNIMNQDDRVKVRKYLEFVISMQCE